MNNSFVDTLKAGLLEYNYNVTDMQIEKLVIFNNLVMETNKHTNLTAIEDGVESAKKHFLDSVNPSAMEIIKSAQKTIDVGSGAGFPGIPLAVLNNDIHFTLVDTRKKRCEFMEQAIEHLKLNNVDVIWKRAEELGKDAVYREQYDIACARALAAMPTLLEYLSPFVKINGKVIFYKGSNAQNEIDASKNAADTLGVDKFIISPYTIFGENTQYFMVHGKKIMPTPTKYPRKSGLPTKRPL